MIFTEFVLSSSSFYSRHGQHTARETILCGPPAGPKLGNAGPPKIFSWMVIQKSEAKVGGSGGMPPE